MDWREEFWGKYEARLRKIALGFSHGNYDDAEDLLAEVHLEWWEKNNPQAGVGYLWIALRNRATDRARKRKRTPPMVGIVDTDFDDSFCKSGYFCVQLIVRDPDPDMVTRVVKDAIEQVRPVYREVVAKRLIDDLDQEQTAEALGIPVGTVKSRYTRGLDELRPLVKELLGV